MGKGTLKALGREALRTGGMILTDIAKNPLAERQSQNTCLTGHRK